MHAAPSTVTSDSGQVRTRHEKSRETPTGLLDMMKMTKRPLVVVALVFLLPSTVPGAAALIGGRGGFPGLPSPFMDRPKLGTTVPEPRGVLPFRWAMSRRNSQTTSVPLSPPTPSLSDIINLHHRCRRPPPSLPAAATTTTTSSSAVAGVVRYRTLFTFALANRTTEDQLVQKLTSTLPVDAKVDDATARWFLRDRYLNVENARAKIIARERWRRTFEETMQRVDTTREASSRKGYLHGELD